MHPGSTYERSIFGLIGLIIVLFLIGLFQAIFHSDSTVDADITIEAPAAEVWPYISEPERRSGWENGVLAVNPLTGDGIAPDDTNLLFMQKDGDSWQIDERIMIADKPHLWRVERSSGRRQGSVTITLTPTGDGAARTRVAYKHVFEEQRFWRRFFAPWLAYRADNQSERMLERLKELVEHGP